MFQRQATKLGQTYGPTGQKAVNRVFGDVDFELKESRLNDALAAAKRKRLQACPLEPVAGLQANAGVELGGS